MNLKFNRIYIDAEEAPNIIERYAGNMYLYRFDLRKEEPIESEEETNTNRYSFVEVRLKGYPNRNETIKYLLRQLVTLEDELKLINDYNEAMLSTEVDTNSSEYQEYVTYLQFRKSIKLKVRTDFNNNNF